jgi:hypothetical protein
LGCAVGRVMASPGSCCIPALPTRPEPDMAIGQVRSEESVDPWGLAKALRRVVEFSSQVASPAGCGACPGSRPSLTIHCSAPTIHAHGVARGRHGSPPRRTQDEATHDVGHVVDANSNPDGRGRSPVRDRSGAELVEQGRRTGRCAARAGPPAVRALAPDCGRPCVSRRTAGTASRGQGIYASELDSFSGQVLRRSGAAGGGWVGRRGRRRDGRAVWPKPG